MKKNHNHCMDFLYSCLALLACGDLLAFEAYLKLKLQNESIIDVLL